MTSSDSGSTSNIAHYSIPMVNSTESPNENGPKVKKTRNRVPISCEACRKRKMKCDKKRPCSSCTKNGTISQCKYSALTSQAGPLRDNSSGSNLKLQFSAETIRLKMRINKLENLLAKNNIDFQSIKNDDILMSNTSMEDSKVKGVSANSSDPMIELTNKFDLLLVKENKILHGGTTSYMTTVDNDPHLFSMFKGFFAQHKAQFGLYQKQIRTKLSDFPSKNVHSSVFMDHSVCGEDLREPAAFFSALKNTPFDEAIVRINEILPKMKHLRVLIDNFFEKAYYLVPYIDETTFRQDLECVLYSKEAVTYYHPTTGGSDAFIHITHPSNTTAVAILLIVLRFSYLTIDVKGYEESPNLLSDPEIIDLVRSNVKIGPIYIEYAKLLLINRPNEFNIWRKVELVNIQALLLLKLYSSFSPEDGGENQDSTILLSIIIQMCKILGLYRDPERFASVVSNPGDRIIWRRMFYKVLNLDAINSLNTGFPLIISDDEWDTKLPTSSKRDKEILESFKKGNTVDITPKELRKIVRESAITSDIHLEFKVTQLMRKSMKICNKINSTHKRSEFDALIKETEEFLMFKVNSVQGLISNKVQFDPIYTIFKIPRMKEIELRLDLMQLLYILNYLMFLVLELEKNDNYLSPEEKKENQQRLDNYMYKTTEVTFQLFKIGFDFTTFLTETESIDGDTLQHRNLKKFFNGFQQLLESKISAGVVKCLLFMFSLLLRYHFDNFSLTTLIKNFSNCAESLEVLQWLNVSIKDTETNNEVSSDKQIFVLLFHYLKTYYVRAFSLRNEYFLCWRGAMLTKLFMNFFKLEYPDRFRDLIKAFEVHKIAFNTSQFGYQDSSSKGNSTLSSSYTGGLTSATDESPYEHRSSESSIPHTNSTSESNNYTSISFTTSGSNTSSVSPGESNEDNSPKSNTSTNQMINNSHLQTNSSAPTNFDAGNVGLNENSIKLSKPSYNNVIMSTDSGLAGQTDDQLYFQFDPVVALEDPGSHMVTSVTPNGEGLSEHQKEFLEFSNNDIDNILYPDQTKVYDSAVKEIRSGPYSNRQLFDFEEQFSSMYEDILNYSTTPSVRMKTDMSSTQQQPVTARGDSSIDNTATQSVDAAQSGISEADSVPGLRLEDMSLPSPFNYGFLIYGEQQEANRN